MALNRKAKFHIKNIKQSEEFSEYDLSIRLLGKKNISIKNIRIPLLGIHNIRNATAAAAIAFTIGISKKLLKKD